MQVGYIWDLAIAGNSIFAATEQGVFVSTDDATWTATGLTGVEVKALALNGNTLYAGTWGQGVFFSTDGGANWTTMNDGFEGSLAIHALTVSSQGDLFAGLFDDFVYKFDGATWTKTSISYRFIWTLEAADGIIYAGTYGGGLYVSGDNGASWAAASDGIPARYIYDVEIAPDGDVFVSGWNGGIYVLTGTSGRSAAGSLASVETTWASLGMLGFEVSTIYSDGGTLYVGTGDGRLFAAPDPVITGVNDDATVPMKYELNQNYPNPFNPSTTISFTIAEPGMVSLTVYNILGQQVAALVSQEMSAGTHQVNWSAGNLSTGVYLYRIETPGFTATKKMMLMK